MVDDVLVVEFCASDDLCHACDFCSVIFGDAHKLLGLVGDLMCRLASYRFV